MHKVKPLRWIAYHGLVPGICQVHFLWQSYVACNLGFCCLLARWQVCNAIQRTCKLDILEQGSVTFHRFNVEELGGSLRARELAHKVAGCSCAVCRFWKVPGANSDRQANWTVRTHIELKPGRSRILVRFMHIEPVGRWRCRVVAYRAKTTTGFVDRARTSLGQRFIETVLLCTFWTFRCGAIFFIRLSFCGFNTCIITAWKIDLVMERM